MMHPDYIPSARQRWLIWALAPSLLFLPLLLMSRVQFFGNSDALFYSNILAMMTQSLKSGVLFPRWLPDANAGFGSPVMMFYAPLAYTLTAMVNLPLTPFNLDSGNQLIIGMYASQVVSGYTSYIWLKRDFDERVALIGSLLFVLLPYKLIYIYIHINLAQLWALAVLPLWMCAAQDIFEKGRRAIGCYALAFAGVYYMHPLTLIAFGAVPAGYALWFGRRRLLNVFLRLCAAHMLGLGLCALQALPQHFYMQYIHAERFLQGNYSWRNNLFHIDVVLCAYYGIIALLMGVAIHNLPLRFSVAARRSVFWIIVLGGVFFLSQKISIWLWELLPPLQYLQFPAARLHCAALLAATYLICLWLSAYREMEPLGKVAYGRVTLALLIAVFTAGTVWRVYAVESDPAHASSSYLGDAQAAKIISTPVSIYETIWGCIDPGRAYLLYKQGQVPQPMEVIGGEAKIKALDWLPSRIVFSVDVKSAAASIAVRQCYFPQWSARDSRGQRIALHHVNPYGLLGLTVPSGEHMIEIYAPLPASEALSQGIAAIALIFCALLIWFGVKKVNEPHRFSDVFP